jgi:hypothetical protein
VYQPAAVTADNESYVPFQGSWNNRPQVGLSVGTAEDFARPAQWNTAGAWLLAFSYLFTLIAALAYVVVNNPTLALESVQARQSTIEFASIWISVALWFLQVLFVLLDRRKLRSYGYARPASFWWILLLPPLIYLIMRGIAVSREVRHGFGPLIAYLVSAGAVVLLGIVSAVAIPALLASRAGAAGSESGVSFASSLQKGLDAQGGSYAVTCPPTISDSIGATFSCIAVPSGSGTSHTLNIEVVRGADGQPTAKLLAVSPPITG